MARLSAAARALGWFLFGVAVVAFVAGSAVGISGPVVIVVVASLVVGSVLLLPAIIVGFGVRAAEREDPGP